MKKSLMALLVLALSPMAHCEENSSTDKTHTLGFGFGWTNMRSDLVAETSDIQGYGSYFYSYQFTPVWAINFDHTTADTKNIGFGDSDVAIYRQAKYNANIISAKGRVALSPRWQFYGKLGANQYQMDYTGQQQPAHHQSGLGIALAAGVEFRAYNGFGFGFQIQHLDMGDTRVTANGMYFSYLF
ncbi:MAG: porin family protein [Psychrosphaera sp.]|nr:porin family protein [Psychrosphaera sp.]